MIEIRSNAYKLTINNNRIKFLKIVSNMFMNKVLKILHFTLV